MPLPRPRFTVRRLMIAVAVTALILEVVHLKRRHDSHLRTSEDHLRQSQVFVAHGKWSPTLHEEMAQEERSAEYHREMAKKYREAARHPWIPVPPDPPDPGVIYLSDEEIEAFFRGVPPERISPKASFPPGPSVDL